MHWLFHVWPVGECQQIQKRNTNTKHCLAQSHSDSGGLYGKFSDDHNIALALHQIQNISSFIIHRHSGETKKWTNMWRELSSSSSESIIVIIVKQLDEWIEERVKSNHLRLSPHNNFIITTTMLSMMSMIIMIMMLLINISRGEISSSVGGEIKGPPHVS